MDLKLQIYVKIFSVYQLYVYSIEYMYIHDIHRQNYVQKYSKQAYNMK